MSEYNILVDCLPRTVELGGMEVGIETNFRTSIVFEMLMLDDSVSDADNFQKKPSTSNYKNKL